MESTWKTGRWTICGKKMYYCYCVKNKNDSDYLGNPKIYGGSFETKRKAKKAAAEFNMMEVLER